MSSDWRTMTLRAAGVALIDCVHKTPAAIAEGYPYVTIPEMKNGRINFQAARKISRTDFLEWTKKAQPRPNDVVLSRRTNPGVIAVDDTETDFALGQNLVLLRADGRHVFPPFLRWLAQSPEWWGHALFWCRENMEAIIANANGSTFQEISKRNFRPMQIVVAPAPIRDAFNQHAGRLVDLIAANEVQSRTLAALRDALLPKLMSGELRVRDAGRALAEAV